MTDTMDTPNTTDTVIDEGWRDAGAAWEHAASDWAYLFEPYARDAIEAVFDRLGVGAGTELFDMACGAGYAMSVADNRGARVTGLDASAGLIDIARRRVPTADVRVGTMFDLPFADASFDAVSSFNGIWGGCHEACAEAARVLRPDGGFGITFWGPGRALDLRDYFIALGSSMPAMADEMIGLASIGAPGVAEEMFEQAGFDRIERAASRSVLEFPDADIAWRALRSPGLVRPALDDVGEHELRRRLMDVLTPFRSADGSYRLVNELTTVTGRRR